MKILYEDFNNVKKCCRTCLRLPSCEFSLYKDVFNAEYCNEYKYQAPYIQFETKDESFIKKVIKMIKEYKNDQK